MADVLVMLGSAKDQPHLERGLPYFEKFQLSYDIKVSSAHRQPDQTAEIARGAREQGYKVIICLAGMAAHLGGVVAAHTTLPVLGVPLGGSALGGVDALYSFVQMPAGVPVATLAIGPAGFANAVIFAAQILSIGDEAQQKRLRDFKSELARG
jgi:phosphoribosylaminoimidazole carboxylase PurE protein